jgi:hypothetical protein
MPMQNREPDVSSEWLMKNAGPVIRYHTAVELLPEEGRTPALKKDLMTNQRVTLIPRIFWADPMCLLDNLPVFFTCAFAHGKKERKMLKLWMHWLQYGELVAFRINGYCCPAYLRNFLLRNNNLSTELLDFFDVFISGLD